VYADKGVWIGSPWTCSRTAHWRPEHSRRARPAPVRTWPGSHPFSPSSVSYRNPHRLSMSPIWPPEKRFFLGLDRGRIPFIQDVGPAMTRAWCFRPASYTATTMPGRDAQTLMVVNLGSAGLTYNAWNGYTEGSPVCLRWNTERRITTGPGRCLREISSGASGSFN